MADPVGGMTTPACEHLLNNKRRTGGRRFDEGIHPFELKWPEQLDFPA
jgi:hypothetical protein